MESLGSDSDMQLSSPEDDDQGWVSWAWSFVPAIVGTAEEGEEGLYQQRETGGITNRPHHHAHKDPIVSIGFYCTKASIVFKVKITAHEINHGSVNNLQSYPFFFLF